MSTLKYNTWLNTDNTENYKCRAWVNFNGTGTVAIRASGNVSSITDNGVGNYTVNFTTAMPNASYAPNVSADMGTSAASDAWIESLATGSFAIRIFVSGGGYDAPTIVASVHR